MKEKINGKAQYKDQSIKQMHVIKFIFNHIN